MNDTASSPSRSISDSVSKLVSSRDTQLADHAEFVYNEKYGSWMPGNVDPDEWAKENLAGPPPPPKAAGGGGGGGGGGGDGGGGGGGGGVGVVGVEVRGFFTW